MTPPEAMLWTRLRGGGPDRPKFRRQHPIGSVIVDFYCCAARLAVEIDGATHWDDAKRGRDEARDHWLAGQGIDVLRMAASEVYRDLDGAADAVLLRAEELIARRRRGRGPPPPPAALRCARRPVPLPRFAGEELNRQPCAFIQFSSQWML
jgi:very-short-patch-repair endonuclease